MMGVVQPADSAARSLIAPPKACQSVPGDSSLAKARGSMLCFTNYARAQKSLKRLRANSALGFASEHKADDILRCDEFSHQACGREFTYWIERSGYQGCSLGENIAYGTGQLGSSRQIFTAWMNSPGHRSAILSRSYRSIGIGIDSGPLEGIPGAHVWVQNFGGTC